MTEDIIDALLAQARTRLPALLNSVWADRADADAAAGIVVPLPYPEAYNFGLRVESVYDYPFIGVWAVKDDYNTTGPRSGDEGAYHGWALTTHTLVLVAALQSDDEVTLERQVARYTRALWRFLTECQSLPGTSVLALTAVASGRESDAAGLGIGSPNVRGVLFDIEIESEERF